MLRFEDIEIHTTGIEAAIAMVGNIGRSVRAVVSSHGDVPTTRIAAEAGHLDLWLRHVWCAIGLRLGLGWNLELRRWEHEVCGVRSALLGRHYSGSAYSSE